MTPTHVEVLRCGGGCHRGSQDCLATSTRIREIEVMIGKCGVSVGKCEKECAVVSVEEDTECGCGCQTDRFECEAKGLHIFKPELCVCECRDSEVKRQCLQQGRTWQEESCQCGCNQELTCPDGSELFRTTCMCKHLIEEAVVKVINKVDDQRWIREYMDTYISWEVITIGVLLGFILILLTIIFSLIVRLHRMKHALRMKDFSVMEGEYHIYGELPVRRIQEKLEDQEQQEKTYMELESVSSSSGFGSEVSKTDLQQHPSTVSTPVEEPEYTPLVGSLRNRSRTPVARNTKSGIYRGPNCEIEKVTDSLGSASLHPIDEALRLLKHSADQL